MKLETNTLYKAKITDVQFGNIPVALLTEVFANGRQCGVLLEYEIASLFKDCSNGTQGKAADIISTELGDIQCKTYHSNNHDGKYTRGADKGKLKADRKAIFTTQSGLWDSINRRDPKEVKQMIDGYWDNYDYFMYIDICNMNKLEYSFIVIPTDEVKKNAHNGCISYTFIKSQVKKEISL